MVYVHLATGFEEVEALTIVDVLRRADIDAKMVSMTDGKVVQGTHGVNIEADMMFEEADYDNCEMIVLPGGLPGATNLGAHTGLREKITAFAKAGRKVAAICAAPMVLADCGILEGKNATIYPGMEEELKGAQATRANVTVDGSLITGKGPALAMEFALALVEQLRGRDIRDQVAEGLLFE